LIIFGESKLKLFNNEFQLPGEVVGGNGALFPGITSGAPFMNDDRMKGLPEEVMKSFVARIIF
jgi:hypothetical protein